MQRIYSGIRNIFSGQIKYFQNENELLQAANEGHFEKVKQLIAEKTDIETKNAEGETPLIIAVKSGHTEIVKFLLDYGANQEIVSGNDENTPLMIAAGFNRYAILQLLLNHGAIVDTKNKEGETALMFAAYYGHYEITKCLLASQANKYVIVEFIRHHDVYEEIKPLTHWHHSSIISSWVEHKRYDAFMLACQKKHIVIASYLEEWNNAESNRAQLDLCPHAINIPVELICPISKKLMNDPVTINGQTYDRLSLAELFYNEKQQKALTEYPKIIQCSSTNQWIEWNQFVYTGTDRIMQNLIKAYIKKMQEITNNGSYDQVNFYEFAKPYLICSYSNKALTKPIIVQSGMTYEADELNKLFINTKKRTEKYNAIVCLATRNLQPRSRYLLWEHLQETRVDKDVRIDRKELDHTHEKLTKLIDKIKQRETINKSSKNYLPDLKKPHENELTESKNNLNKNSINKSSFSGYSPTTFAGNASQNLLAQEKEQAEQMTQKENSPKLSKKCS